MEKVLCDGLRRDARVYNKGWGGTLPGKKTAKLPKIPREAAVCAGRVMEKKKAGRLLNREVSRVVSGVPNRRLGKGTRLVGGVLRERKSFKAKQQRHRRAGLELEAL